MSFRRARTCARALKALGTFIALFYDESWSTILSIIGHLYRHPSSYFYQTARPMFTSNLTGLKKHSHEALSVYYNLKQDLYL